MRYIFILIITVLFACQDSAKSPAGGVEKLYKDYEVQPTAQSARLYLDSLSSYLAGGTLVAEERLPHLERAVDVSTAQGMLNDAAGFLVPLIKDFPDHNNNVAHLTQLGDIMHAKKLNHASNVIYNELVSQYPDEAQLVDKKALIDPIVAEQEDYLVYLFDQMTVDPDETGINRKAALRYVDAAEALALAAPNNSGTPNHLYGAAEVARSLRTFPKAMSLYDWFLEKYPDNDKAPNVLFIKGFILEQDYQRDDEAKLIYEEFLKKYPDHNMAESARFLLNNIGKSDEQILKEIEESKEAN